MLHQYSNADRLLKWRNSVQSAEQLMEMNKTGYREPITSESAKQDGNEIEHPTDLVRYKHAFIEEEQLGVRD